jgi:hypothetical protein
LVARRQLVARHWLKDVNAIANFALENGSDGVVLKFDDLMIAEKMTNKAEYRYEISGSAVNGERRNERMTTLSPRIPLGQTLAGETKIKIWTTRDRASSSPVTVVVNSKPGGNYGILRIERS